MDSKRVLLPGLVEIADDVRELVATNNVRRRVLVNTKFPFFARDFSHVIRSRLGIAPAIIGDVVQRGEHLLAGQLPVHDGPIPIEIGKESLVQNDKSNVRWKSRGTGDVPENVAKCSGLGVSVRLLKPILDHELEELVARIKAAGQMGRFTGLYQNHKTQTCEDNE